MFFVVSAFSFSLLSSCCQVCKPMWENGVKVKRIVNTVILCDRIFAFLNILLVTQLFGMTSRISQQETIAVTPFIFFWKLGNHFSGAGSAHVFSVQIRYSYVITSKNRFTASLFQFRGTYCNMYDTNLISTIVNVDLCVDVSNRREHMRSGIIQQHQMPQQRYDSKGNC